jgi:hypothetical protein
LEEKPITLYSGSVKPLRVLHHRWRVQRVLSTELTGVVSAFPHLAALISEFEKPSVQDLGRSDPRFARDVVALFSRYRSPERNEAETDAKIEECRRRAAEIEAIERTQGEERQRLVEEFRKRNPGLLGEMDARILESEEFFNSMREPDAERPGDE